MARRMTGKQFNEQITELGFSQIGFAEKIAVNPRTVRHWVAGSYPVPVVVALLVNLMKRLGVKSHDLK